jgi:hypothetical protein
MTTLHINTDCGCLKRGDAFNAGGGWLGLYVVVNGKRIKLRPCHRCGK